MNGEIYSKISAVMSEIGAIGKNNRNAQQQYNFRGVDDVYNALQPALVKNGVFVAPMILSSETKELMQKTDSGKDRILHKTVLTSRFRFYASDGSFIEADALGEAIDYADKSSNKAMSVAFKYVCFQVFCIATKELYDSDSETIEPTPTQQARPQMQTTTQRPPSVGQQVATGVKLSEGQSKAIYAICKSKQIDEAEFLEAHYSGVPKKDLTIKQASEIIEALNAI
jgi:hypothetical protein